jgi:yersiniabactin nonribosomal peptide synthetase
MLALSALHFDLSVYDIFGVLSAGGALVMVMENQRRDPHAWCELIQRHHVTLWNSVPALFDMLLTWCEGFTDATPENLRAVMLSGDWIGLALPARYQPSGRKDNLSPWAAPPRRRSGLTSARLSRSLTTGVPSLTVFL